MSNTKETNIDAWVFNYNSYTGNWRAIKRDNYLELFSTHEGTNPNIIASPRVSTIVEIIEKTDGDREKIAKLLSGENKKDEWESL